MAALAGLIWVMLAVTAASIAPSAYVPKLFHNYHIEHFAAFYVLGFFSAAALPRAPLLRVGLSVGALACLFALARVAGLINRTFYAEDLFSDLVGVLAALVPVYLGRIQGAPHTPRSSPWDR
jgi:hypothetical protein